MMMAVPAPRLWPVSTSLYPGLAARASSSRAARASSVARAARTMPLWASTPWNLALAHQIITASSKFEVPRIAKTTALAA